MRLISRHRSQRRAKPPRIAFSQAEITADLHYPASRRPALSLRAGRRSTGR
jgi:hypothetical protein